MSGPVGVHRRLVVTWLVVGAIMTLAPCATPDAGAPGGTGGLILAAPIDQAWSEDPDRVQRFWKRGLPAAEQLHALEATGQWPRRDEHRSAMVEGPWVRVGPNGNVSGRNGRISGLHLRGDGAGSYYVYAGAVNGGIWRARLSEGTGHWTSLGDNLPNPSARAFAVHPWSADAIIVGTGEWSRARGAGMFRTTDAGATWESIPLNPIPDSFFCIRYALGDPATLVAASDQGILRSTDGGSIWSYVLTGFSSDIALDQQNQSVMYACSSSGTGGVFKSTDAGQVWTQLTSPVLPTGAAFGRGSLAVHRLASQNVALIVESGGNLQGVFRSTNGGATWSNITSNLDGFGAGQINHAQAITYHPNDPSQIYIGAVDIARTTNGGGSWLIGQTAAGIPIGHYDITQLHFYGATTYDKLWICNDGGIYLHTLGGQTESWNGNAIDGLACSEVSHLAARRSFRVMGLQDNGIMRSTNGGASWEYVGGGDGDDAEITDPETFDSWWVDGVYSGDRPWTIRKHLHGTNPIDTNNPGAWAPHVFFDRRSATMFSHGGTNIIASPTEGPPSWSNVAPILDGARAVRGSYVDGKLLLVNYYNPWGRQLTVCTDSGGWTCNTFEIPDDGSYFETTIASTEWPEVSWGGLEGGAGAPKLLSTIDTWQAWRDISGTLASVGSIHSIAVAPFDHRRIFAGTDIGMFVTTDGGGTWSPFQEGLPIVRCKEVRYLVDPAHSGQDRLVVATYGRGVWERSIVAPPIYYVDPANTEVENGSIEHPYNTIGEAVTAAVDGSIIGMRGGEYSEPQTILKRTTLMAYESAVVIR